MLPFGDHITVERAQLAILIIVYLIVMTAITCVGLALVGSFSAAASYTVGTIALVAWLLAGALWLWYT